MNEAFYTIDEFARLLKVHTNTVRRLIKKNRIHALKLGSGRNSAYRIPSSEIHRMGEVNLDEIIEKEVEKRIKIKEG